MNIKEGVQQFIDWSKRKIFHHFNDRAKAFYFRENEVWWVALGKNVGYEIDGKHELFERPVLVLKKYSKDMCFILPLTTQIKVPLPWYQIVIIMGEKLSAINITQGKTISSRRFLRKAGTLALEEFAAVKLAFINQFNE